MELGRCLDIAKPRIVTLEQTSGLMRKGKHSQNFDKIIKQFIIRDYDVRWKIVDMAEFGLPQYRNRLIMIASCPGEPLPSFPEPTHAGTPGNSGLVPFTSVNKAISMIRPGETHHTASQNYKGRGGAYDGNKPLANILMTEGAKVPHPSGKRPYSI
ncbi:MAG: hypothetical protein Q9169_003844 [Polycauliona sp. 2 TL-2023]